MGGDINMSRATNQQLNEAVEHKTSITSQF